MKEVSSCSCLSDMPGPIQVLLSKLSHPVSPLFPPMSVCFWGSPLFYPFIKGYHMWIPLLCSLLLPFVLWPLLDGDGDLLFPHQHFMWDIHAGRMSGRMGVVWREDPTCHKSPFRVDGCKVDNLVCSDNPQNFSEWGLLWSGITCNTQASVRREELMISAVFYGFELNFVQQACCPHRGSKGF